MFGVREGWSEDKTSWGGGWMAYGVAVHGGAVLAKQGRSIHASHIPQSRAIKAHPFGMPPPLSPASPMQPMATMLYPITLPVMSDEYRPPSPKNWK